jgi:hypothetical protein
MCSAQSEVAGYDFNVYTCDFAASVRLCLGSNRSSMPISPSQVNLFLFWRLLSTLSVTSNLKLTFAQEFICINFIPSGLRQCAEVY